MPAQPPGRVSQTPPCSPSSPRRTIGPPAPNGSFGGRQPGSPCRAVPGLGYESEPLIWICVLAPLISTSASLCSAHGLDGLCHQQRRRASTVLGQFQLPDVPGVFRANRHEGIPSPSNCESHPGRRDHHCGQKWDGRPAALHLATGQLRGNSQKLPRLHHFPLRASNPRAWERSTIRT